MSYKSVFAEALHQKLHEYMQLEKIESVIEIPKHEQHGDLAFPCFELAKSLRKSPVVIAQELANTIESPMLTKIEAVGPYINAFLNRQRVSNEIISLVTKEKDAYGAHAFGKGKTIIIDFSSPNIAKPFSMGHLRSTVIGNALYNISEKCGYEVVGINYVGDWGTQFGKLMSAYKRWGSEEKVKQNPIKELFTLYVKFHEDAKENPDLEEEGRAWFKKLEDGDEEATHLWKWFRTESLQEFSRIYELLGVSFDSFNGEAFYNDKMDDMVKLLEEKQLLVESDGAQVVTIEEKELPPCLIKKSDGATLYATRDLTAAIYRQNTYQFDRALYVVGGEQSLHFEQLFAVLKKMGYSWVEGMSHIPFGLILKDGKKMSTRKGKVVLLEEVIQEAIALAEKNIEEKNPSLPNKKETARQVGVGAIIFQDLKNERTNSIEFSLENMLKFEGETGPYVQYTHARAFSILRKGNFQPAERTVNLTDDLSWGVVKLLEEFPAVLERAFERYEPSQIAKYVLDLAQAFNKYYGNVRILEDNDEQQSRLQLVYAVTIVLKGALDLLGLQAPLDM
ncbi:arginine--tRNA ligase [Bacillus sp. 165]|uniref:arginine--tRNA ligase n=1 Tax=Bacillus sp. 165 TaxID=1529117 RepID=UPI001ADC2C04|nr:arginine--tRNA ligase [Bacillus sp. 165]MBO9129363.1 arginine--tRNA ligase [Bacillus sp. 165]